VKYAVEMASGGKIFNLQFKRAKIILRGGAHTITQRQQDNFINMFLLFISK
jgi:hypothetical protein